MNGLISLAYFSACYIVEPVAESSTRKLFSMYHVLNSIVIAIAGPFNPPPFLLVHAGIIMKHLTFTLK